MEFKISEGKNTLESIYWQFNETVSFYIDGNYFDVQSKYIRNHTHPNFDYKEI